MKSAVVKPRRSDQSLELTMKHDLEGNRATGKHSTAQNKTADADRPHNTFNCLPNFPTDQAGTAADDVLQKVHWVIHENLR